MKEQARICRLPPCPPYDVEGTESWLSDMAAQGWMLERDGVFFGVASFGKKGPAAIRYRLEAAPKQAGDWDANSGRPDNEAVELNADYGWEYVARRGQFYIYRNENPGARELNTDPQVQALSLKALQKRQAANLRMSIFWWILYPLLHFWRGASLPLAMAEAGLLIVALSVAIAVWNVLDGVFEVIHLQKLKSKLKAGVSLNHGKNWRNDYRLYFGKRALKCALVLVWIAMLLHLWNDDVLNVNKQELASYGKKPPFATIKDFAEGNYEETWQDLRYDYVMEWTNAVVNSGIKWGEHASIRREDGTVLQGGLYITYYDVKSEWLAKVLAAEYQRFDCIRAGKDYALLNCPDFGLDSAVAYTNELHFPHIVLRQGKVVLRAYFYQTGPHAHMSLEEWAGILADAIR